MKLQRIQIEPTNRCNLKCHYCRRTYWSRAEGDMTIKRYYRLLHRLPLVPRLHIQGVGEPLLNKNLPTMISYARSRGSRVGISTNISLLTSRVARSLFDAGINRLNLSLDTLDPQEFRRLRSGLSLHKVLSNIKSLADIRCCHHYTDTELAIAIVAEQTCITFDNLSTIIAFAADVGLDEVYVQNLNPVFLPSHDHFVHHVHDYSHYQEIMQLVEAFAIKRGIKFFAPSLGNPDLARRCQWPFHGCNITWDGFVSPCCLQPDPEVLHFGNVFEIDFDQIWHSPAYCRFRERVQADCEFLCRECPERYGQMWHPKAAPFGDSYCIKT